MASGSSVFIDLKFELDDSVVNRSTGELVSALKSSFRESDFARVESILIQREEKLKEELAILERVNEWLKYQRESSGMETLKVREQCEELQQLNSQLIKEKIEFLERERKAVDAAELWEMKYELLRSRILKLEDDVKLLVSVAPNVRVSSENRNYAEMENGTGNVNVNVNVVEGNVDLVGENVDRAGEDSRGPPSRSIVQLSDSDDDSASGEILSRNGLTSQRVADSDCSSQMDVQCRTRLLKRKQDSCPNVSENKNCNSDSVEDEDVDVDGPSLTADCKVAKVQKLIDGNDCFFVNHCSEMAVSSRSNNAEKFCPPSSQEAGILRQCEAKRGSERISINLTGESFLSVPAVCNVDDSSSSRSSSSGSESDVDLDFDFPQLTRIINDEKWESESHMFAAFEEENELYLKAVCALYRQQMAVEKLPRSSTSSNNRGVNQFNSLRGSTLAEFLTDGDPQGKLKKSVSELLQYDPKGLDDCKKIASDHSKRLFEIYQKKEDPLFMS